MHCLACGNGNSRELFAGIESCAVCQFAWADVSLSAEEWKNLYGTDYFFGEEYVDYLGEEKALRRNFQRNLKFMAQYLPSGKLLEVGCAYGFFLDEARKYYAVEGVDVHEDGCRYAREKFSLSAQPENFLTKSIEEHSLDAVVMWDVLEHLPNPQEFIEKSCRVLKEKGYLFFCTLDITSFLARAQGRAWRQIHPPTHVSYFSRRSLEVMLERAGFDMVAVKYFGEYRSWNNTWFNLLVLRWKKKKLYDFLKRRGWLNGEYYLNTFDHVYMVAQKRSP